MSSSELAEKHGNPWEYRRLNTISVKMTGYKASMVKQVPWLDKVDEGRSIDPLKLSSAPGHIARGSIQC
jgi:hypothetical protein